MERSLAFLAEHFERVLVVLLVASLAALHWFIDYKVAFLSFYYLPVIVAGFHLGKRTGVWSAVLSVGLVAFEQLVEGLTGAPGFTAGMTLALVPWAGFLILTGYVVGSLAEQRADRLADLRSTYVQMLELLTFHLESTRREGQGHSFRVAERAVSLGRVLGMREGDLEQLRVAALLHELGPHDPRVARLFDEFPGQVRGLPVAASMRASLETVRDFTQYYAHVGVDFPVDALRIALPVKILAVADAFDTLQLASPGRPALTPWAALEELERSAGITFGSEVITALRQVALGPSRAVVAEAVSLGSYRETARF